MDSQPLGQQMPPSEDCASEGTMTAGLHDSSISGKVEEVKLVSSDDESRTAVEINEGSLALKPQTEQKAGNKVIHVDRSSPKTVAVHADSHEALVGVVPATESALPDAAGGEVHEPIPSNPSQYPCQAAAAASNASNSSETLHIAGLQVDSDRDNDSAIGDPSTRSTTTSVRSSIYEFIEENGRTYHRFREGKYYLPNDELEQDRLDLQHHLFLLTLSGELYNAPIKDLQGGVHNVLDLGTGTGIWAIEFASIFPSANVIGTDLSPIQPEYVPPNCHFEVDDAEDPWTFTYRFDYIHGRALATCFKSHLTVIRSAFAALRPGGYLELQDCIIPFRCIDDTLRGTALEQWVDLIMRGTTVLGKDWTRVAQYRKYLEDSGFVDVVERRYEWPVGTWAKGERMKTLGLWYQEDLLSGLQAFSMAVLTRGLGMSVAEVEVILVKVRQEIKSNRIHVFIPVRVVYGRKPS